MEKQEENDLSVLRKAITTVTGKENPWIIGCASDFASGLLRYVDGIRGQVHSQVDDTLDDKIPKI